MTNVLNRLLDTLDTRLHAFAVCEVGSGARLVFEPTETVEVHYVLSGAGFVQVGSDEARPIQPHCILIVPPHRQHSLSSSLGELQDVSWEEVCSMFADGLIKVDAAAGKGELLTVCGTISATYGGAAGLFDFLTEPLIENVGAVQQLRSAFHTMFTELASPSVGTRALTEALMQQCLILLLRQHLTRQTTASPLFASLQDMRLARVVTAIIERPGGRHSLQDLAAAAGMSRSSFSERFSQVFGESPLDFLQRVRLRQAAHLLSVTDLSVNVVAASVGYASRSYFSRAFRAAFGVDPTTYRSVKAGEGGPRTPPKALAPEGPE